MVVDVSQSATYRPWQINYLPSLRRGSKYVVGTRLIAPSSLFRMMGWPRGSFEFSPGSSWSSAMSLLGNMLAPPVIGGIMVAVLAACPGFLAYPSLPSSPSSGSGELASNAVGA
eukprot:3692695-Alexandrium_andersonii.AAC.1